MIQRLSIDELRQIFLSLPVSICVLDREIRYLAANSKYASLCDASLASLFGKSMQDFCPSHLVENAVRDFGVFDTGGSVTDHEIIYGDGTFLVSVNPLTREQDKGVSAIAVALTDVSKLKELETALIVSNDNLLAAYNKIRVFAETDALTGLANRYELEKFFEREIRRCRREHHPISVAIIDVDFFKLYNDRNGHIAGDECLKAIAATIQSSIRRPGDCVARYGGEEFVVVLPNTDLAGAEHVSLNIQRAISALDIRRKASPFAHVTVSIGVAAIEAIPRKIGSTDVRDSLLGLADKALYSAKDSGRNCVKVWNDKP